MLTNNEIKYIIKLIRSNESRIILLNGTTRNYIRKILNFLRPLILACVSLIKNILAPSAKIVLIPLELMATASATDSAIQNKIYGSGIKTLMFLNEEFDNTVKIVGKPKIPGR